MEFIEGCSCMSNIWGRCFDFRRFRCFKYGFICIELEGLGS